LDRILEGALTDPALFHALSLVLTLAANANVPNVEILTYRGEVINGLRTSMSASGWKPNVSSITAMLMLIGYEYRIESSDSDSISTHIRGVQAMMGMYEAENIAVVEQIQRALFWQDLLSCFVLGTIRLLSHDMYNDWKYPRHLEGIPRWKTPTGFSGMIEGWPLDFAFVLQDLAMLCMIVDASASTGDTLFADDVQANLESRLVDLLSASRLSRSSVDPIYEACIYATYLCTYKLSVGIWNGCFVPEICVDRILSCLTHAVHDPRWAWSPSLLLWLLFVAGGLTGRLSMRQRVKTIVERVFAVHLGILHQEWESVKTSMKAFIWSESAIEGKVFRFWRELHSATVLPLHWCEPNDTIHCAA
jgi:hypothetical protein